MNRISSKNLVLVMTILLLINICIFCSSCSEESDNVTSVHISPASQANLAQLPPDAAIIFYSSRAYDTGDQDIPAPMQIYSMNADGSNVTQLTLDAPIDIIEHVAVSFDRKYMVANEVVDEGEEKYSLLWIYDFERETKARLVPGFYTAGEGGVDWSPEGFIYFMGREKQPQSMADLGEADIYRIRPDGSGLSRLTKTSNSAELDISVSQDGAMVAYVNFFMLEQNGQSYGKPQIWVMNADGTNQRMVFDGGPEPPNHRGEVVGGHDPEFSLDNNRLVFSRVNSNYANFPQIPGLNTAHDLFIINIDGTGMQRLTPEGAVNIIPDWRNGKILYTEYNDADIYVGLAVINTDGSGTQRLESGLAKVWHGGRHGKWIP